MEEIEIWKDIPGYEGLYQVGSLGNIKSLNYNKTGRAHLLKYNITKTGYAIVHLHRAGRENPLLVSRLVCAAFHENPNNYPCVNHKDENRLNNRADNLEWCTYSYNTSYGSRCKRMLETRKKNCGEKAEKPVIQLSISGELVASFCSIAEACRKTGANHRKISACCHGYRKKHFGFRWAFGEENIEEG